MILETIAEMEDLSLEDKIDKLTDVAHTLNLTSRAVQNQLKIYIEALCKEKHLLNKKQNTEPNKNTEKGAS